MILLVTPSLRAEECTLAIRQATREQVAVAGSLHQAAMMLRTESYLAVVLDQHLLETEAYEAENVMENLDTAIPLQMNFAISGVERLVREVRAAVRRRRREETAAREAAIRTLHSELNSTVTALLLSCEMALATPGLPLEAAEQLRSARDLVQKLCSRLEATPALV